MFKGLKKNQKIIIGVVAIAFVAFLIYHFRKRDATTKNNENIDQQTASNLSNYTAPPPILSGSTYPNSFTITCWGTWIITMTKHSNGLYEESQPNAYPSPITQGEYEGWWDYINTPAGEAAHLGNGCVLTSN